MEITRETLEHLARRAARAEAETADERFALADVEQAIREDVTREATPEEPQAEQLHLFDPTPYEVER